MRPPLANFRKQVEAAVQLSRQELLAELAATGVNHNPANIVTIARNVDGKIIFLETGTAKAGLLHVMQRHGDEFAAHGVSAGKVPDLVMTAATRGTIVGYQGKDKGRPIFQVLWNGKTWKVAITVGGNGFIVGANLAGAPV